MVGRSCRKDNNMKIRKHKRSNDVVIMLDFMHNEKRIRKIIELPFTKENEELVRTKVYPKLKQALIDGVKEIKPFNYYYKTFIDDKESLKSFDSKFCIYEKVNEFFKNKKVDEITRLDVKKYLNKLDMKAVSKREYLTTIRGVLDIAIDDEAISNNVATNIKLATEEEKDIRIFSEKEIELLLSKAEGMFKNYLGIAFHTGMRGGEIMALKQADIKTNFIDVKKSLYRKKITTPKTKYSVREVPLTNIVRHYIENQMNSKSLYLFHREDGRYIDTGTAYFRKQWSKLLKDCNIERVPLKNTRHTYITYLLNSNKFKIMDIAKFVGHNSPRMINTKYSGFIKNEKPSIEEDFNPFWQHIGNGTKTEESEKAL